MRRTRLYFLLAVIAFFTSYGNVKGQLNVSSTMTPQQWVQNVLIGTGVVSSNVTFTGAPGSSGTFSGNSNLGLFSGVILTSGSILNAPGPNLTGSKTTANTTTATGDADLNLVTGDPTTQTHDASVLEFDFVPESDTVKFRYVFGSEEYNDFVNSGFNDVFGFFISGPGIAGPYSNNSENIALLPYSTTPVAINSINNGYSGSGTPSSGPCNNCAYFVDNLGGSTVEYDGFTVVLTAIRAVIPCQTYHIKLAIADVSDWSYDSGVFLEEGSFTSTAIGVTTNYVSPGNPNLTAQMAIEGCRKAVMKFSLPYARIDSTWVKITKIIGNATVGVDYTLTSVDSFNVITKEVLIKPYHMTGQIEINPIYDGITEGTEYVVIGIRKTICDTIDTLISIPIVDYLNIEMTKSMDTSICEGQTQLHVYPTGGMPPYNIQWSPIATLDNATITEPMSSPNQTTVYHVQIKDSTRCSVGIDSIKITYNRIPVVSFKPEPFSGCDSLSVTFRNNTVPFSSAFSWDFGDGTSSTQKDPTHIFHYDPLIPKYNISLLATTTAGCFASYLINNLVTVHPLPVAEFVITPSDSLAIDKASVTFSNQSSANATHFDWSFGDALNTTSTDVNPVFQYHEPGYFTVLLKVTSDFGCEDTISHMMKVVKETNFKPLIPNIITPNGDGKNDYFVIQNVADSTQEPQPLTEIMLPQNELIVYNRWGKKVYDQAPYTNEWDGNGMPDGVYYYIFRYKKRDTAYQFDGTVTIMR